MTSLGQNSDADLSRDEENVSSCYKTIFHAPNWRSQYDPYVKRVQYRNARKLKECFHSPRFWEEDEKLKLFEMNTQQLVSYLNNLELSDTRNASDPVQEYGSNDRDVNFNNPTSPDSQFSNAISENDDRSPERISPRPQRKVMFKDKENVDESTQTCKGVEEDRMKTESNHRVLRLCRLQNIQRPTSPLSQSSTIHSNSSTSSQSNSSTVQKYHPRGTATPKTSTAELHKTELTSSRHRPPFSLYGRGETSNQHMTHNVLAPQHVYDSALKAKLARELLKQKFKAERDKKNARAKQGRVRFGATGGGDYSSSNNENSSVWMSEYHYRFNAALK